MPIPHLKPRRRSLEPLARPSRRPLARHRSLIRRLGNAAIVASCLLVIVVVTAFAVFSRGLPDPDELSDRAVAQSTRIYARDGTTLLYEIHGTERRTVIELNDVPEPVRQAAIAIEDKDFYDHGGFKFTSIIRALVTNLLRGGKVQGGSTITQQLVKNSILTSEKTYTRKIKELILAYQMERKFTKDQILKLYFNQIPYGANAYGIEAAAETYFGKPARSLSLAEGALLASLPKAPTYYSPYGNHRDELLARYQLVLERMREEEYITRDQEAVARATDVLGQVKPRREAILAPHFVFYVRELLAERYPESLIERGGLRVVTTLDIDKQRIAEEEVTRGAATNEKRYRAKNAALVSLDVKTGEIVAMVGSRDYFDTENDGNVNVTVRERNPGSSFKPFVYATAFTKGYTPETILYDLETDFGPDGSGQPYIPKDYDGKERGPVTMRQGLAGSLNIPAVQTLYLAGLKDVVELANALGYTTFKKPDEYGLALALGGAGIKLLDHAAAFGVLARDGVRLPSTAILRVEDAAGKVLEETKPAKGEEVLEPNVARLVTSILSDNQARSFIFGSRSPLVLRKHPAAVKTGTTQDWRDGLTIGFTGWTVTGVWAANNDYSPMARGADGVLVAAPIWNAYMNRVHEGLSVIAFRKPKPNSAKKPILRGEVVNEDEVLVDRLTGRRIPISCRASWPETFRKVVVVRQPHSIIHYVDRDHPGGDPPTDPAKDPMYERWERSVARWAAKKYPAVAFDEESCDLRSPDRQPSLTITSPADGAAVSGETVSVAVAVSGPRPISRVDYALDGVVITTSRSAPFGASISLAGASAGVHTLTATVFDEVENSGQASVSLQLAASAATVFFLEPTPNTQLPAGASLTVRGFVSSPADVRAVALVERSSGNLQELQRVESPTESTVVFVLQGLATGVHELALQVSRRDGKFVSTDFLTVAVAS